MRSPPRRYPASENPLRADESWYGWDADEPDNGWLLTYVDVLSVILAMMVVLLGRMAIEQMPPAIAQEKLAPESEISAEPILATTLDEAPVLSEPEREQPLQPPRVPSREERFGALVAQRFRGEVTATQKDNGVSIVIPGVILFESAKADLEDSARSMLTQLVEALQEIGEASVSVEGHSDDRPIQGGEFNSNWELAAARATMVTRYLLSQGLAEERLRAISYGQSRPIADNGTLDGRAANRRVELRVEFLDSPEVIDVVDTDTRQSLADGKEHSL